MSSAVTQDLPHIWTAVQDALRRAVDGSTYDVWLAPLSPVGLDGGTLTVQAPAELRDWVAQRFARPLGEAVCGVLGATARVEVVTGEQARAPQGPPAGADAEPAFFPEAELNPKFTFDQFVIGDANRLAHAAALAVAEGPGQAYNPLFIYGPPGIGKTHLLHSVGHYVREHGSGMSVHYTTIERFTNEFIATVQHGSSVAKERFKDRYRRNDVLLIDDVQFLAEKARTEEEFFHTFNALYDTGSQLVLTSDRLPKDLGKLEDRMRERFEAGLVTDIQAPDVATRLTVLRKRVQHDHIALPDPRALDVIAERIPTNIRALEGALIRVVAFASLTGRELTAPLAEEVLDGLYGHAPRRRPGNAGATATAAAGEGYGLPAVTVAFVQQLVCEAFSLSQEELLSSSRTARIAWPRQLAMYLARHHTAESLPAIGRHFGGRNHTTVMHAVKRTTERLGTDVEAEAVVRTLTARLTGQADRRA
jgi:chromosomal replication initiator protein